MLKNSQNSPLIRCPKCGRLLPELPPNSVYRCGGCDAFLQANKKSPLNDDVYENSSEERSNEGSHGGFTPTRVSKSPLRFRLGYPTRKSPLRDTISDCLDGHINSPPRENVGHSESFERSVDRKSPLREIGYGHGKSPAFSVRGGAIATDDRRSAKRENFVADSDEIEAKDRVDSVDDSYTDCEVITDQTGVSKPSVSPRRRRTRQKEENLSGQAGRRVYHSGEGIRCVDLPYDDWDDEGDHGGVARRRNRHLRDQHRSSNYRSELLRKYNHLHEKLIRVGYLISHSHYGQVDQGYASTDYYSGPEESSGHRIRNVRSTDLKGSTKIRPHYVSDNPSTGQSTDSSYDPRRKYPHQRSSADSKSDGDSSVHDRKTKVLLVNQNGQLCHPIAGGAPFVICYKCFQLLKLPGKLINMKKSQCRLKCGSCHTILSLDLNTKRSDASDFVPSGADATKRSDEKESDTTNEDKGNAAVLTELELKSSEIPKTGSSQGSSIKKDECGSSEASEINGGFQDSSPAKLSTSLANADVVVNGKLITSDDIRKAEKKAGPISPGEYWYDLRAGFWGVLGYVCLGIIPPFIEEFSSQMLENCSGGDTCIYVNGRELHQSDLDLLCSRGLPRRRYKYYVVDISGKVLDEDTGCFVVNLGKLAPTVESTGCGFGMHSPGTHKY